MENWEAVHRWDWVRRGQWLGSFREGKIRLAKAILEVLRDREIRDGLILDASCGLGY